MSRRNRNRSAKQAEAQVTASLPPMLPDQVRSGQVAPAPVTDKTPTVIGSQLTMAYVSSAYRMATSGYRQQLVDLLNELLERDPGTYAVLSQRVLAVACGRLELVPAVTDKKSKDYDEAQAICDDITRRIDAIPRRTQALANLAWGIYYGPTALENMFERTDDGWSIAAFEFISSRRIAYPEPGTWRPFIWDLGAVFPISYGIGNQAETIRPWGIPIDAYPGKFVLHTPALRGDYASRDGLGREIGFWMALKGMAARGAGDFIERFAKPWVLGTYATTSTGVPRLAEPADIAVGAQAQRGVGAGSLSGALLPDSIKLALQGPGFSGTSTGLTHEKFINLIDDQITKCVRGGTLTTSTGEHGSRSAAEVHERNDIRNARYDAEVLAETFRADVVRQLTRLNHPGQDRLTPRVILHVEKQDPEALLRRAVMAASIGMPLDGRPIAKIIGMDLVDPEDENAVKLSPVKQVDPSDLLTPEERADLREREAEANPEPEPPVVAPPQVSAPTQPQNGAANGVQKPTKPAAEPPPPEA